MIYKSYICLAFECVWCTPALLSHRIFMLIYYLFMANTLLIRTFICGFGLYTGFRWGWVIPSRGFCLLGLMLFLRSSCAREYCVWTDDFGNLGSCFRPRTWRCSDDAARLSLFCHLSNSSRIEDCAQCSPRGMSVYSPCQLLLDTVSSFRHCKEVVRFEKADSIRSWF